MEERPGHGFQFDAHDIVENATAVREPRIVAADDAQDVD